MLERGGKVRAKIVPNISKQTLQAEVIANVEQGSDLYTDSLSSYEGLAGYNHNVINHQEKYVDGEIHTNGMENFWSLLKRSIKGTYVSVDPDHLSRYVDEQAFRFNTRKGNDADRFVLAAGSVVGKRLTYKELIGKEAS